MLGQETEDGKGSELKVQNIKELSTDYYLKQKLSVRISLIAIFAALTIGSSYMLAPFINIEVMSVLLFISGFIFGKYIGGLVGLISSVIYYGWNPFGFDPFIFICTVSLMTLIGFIGGLAKRDETYSKKIEMNRSNCLRLALIGFCFTLLFDLITNIVLAYVWYGGNIIAAFLPLGYVFIIIHVVNNTIAFAFLVIPVHNTTISIHRF